MRFAIGCLLFIAFGSRNSLGFAVTDTVRVLFVGNSYTYYNSMPQIFQAMGEAEFPGKHIKTKFIGGGGATLKQHWETGLVLREIETGKWNYVVLQEQSMLGSAVTEKGESFFGGPDRFFTYARLFDQAIKKNGAEPVYFMTWSRREYKHQQKYLTYAYMTIAGELKSKIAPVGMVWNEVRENRNINLYQKDGSHPSTEGSYLAAATLYAVILNANTEGLPGQLNGYEILKGGDLSGRKGPLCDLTAAEAANIQHAVDELVNRLNSNDGYLAVEQAIREKKPSPFYFIFSRLKTAEGQLFIMIFAVLLFWLIKSSMKMASR